MKALAILAMAMSLMASSVSSHAEMITFSGSGTLNYGDLKGGRSFSNTYPSGSTMFSDLSGINYSSGAVNLNLSYDMYTLGGNPYFGIVSTNQQYVINSITYSANTDNPSASLQIFQVKFIPGNSGRFSITSISMVPTNSLSNTINFSDPTSAIYFRTADLNFWKFPSNSNMYINVGLSITSLDVTRVSPVPEPNASLMMMSGIGIMAFATRRRRKKLHA